MFALLGTLSVSQKEYLYFFFFFEFLDIYLNWRLRVNCLSIDTIGLYLLCQSSNIYPLMYPYVIKLIYLKINTIKLFHNVIIFKI